MLGLAVMTTLGWGALATRLMPSPRAKNSVPSRAQEAPKWLLHHGKGAEPGSEDSRVRLGN